jgi:hypothetical protein
VNTSYEAHLDEQDRRLAEDEERARNEPDFRSLAFYERYLVVRDKVRRKREEG